MPIDSSIYSRMQPLDVSGSVERGLKMGDMIQQARMQNQAQQNDQAMKDAMKRNMTVGADGTPSLNRKAYLSEMAGIDPMKAMEQQKSFAIMDRDEHAAKIKDYQDKLAIRQHILRPAINSLNWVSQSQKRFQKLTIQSGSRTTLANLWL